MKFSIERLARDFHGHPPRAARVTLRRTPRKLMVLGPLHALTYELPEGLPTHTFKARSRPMLATDGKQLFIVGGRFHVTRRGIVDLDTHGRETD